MAPKYLDEAGLRRTIQAVASKMDLKLSGKLNSIVSADQNNIVIDNTNPIKPTINLSSAILSKINSIPDNSAMKLTNIRTITGATTLTLADCGSMINMQGGTIFTTKLPLANTVPIGSRIEFFNTCTVISNIITQGSDQLVLGMGLASSLSLLPSDTAVFELGPTGKWVLAYGSAQLAYSGAFASSGGTNSFQRLPSGLFIQKGKITCNQSNQWYTFSFPTMFNNSGGVVICITPIVTGSDTVHSGHTSPTNTGVQIYSSRSNTTFDVIAIGN